MRVTICREEAMKNLTTRRALSMCVLALGLLAAGCAKKSVQAPPTPPAPPAQKETPPVPKEEPKPEPPSPPKSVSSSDFSPAFFDFDSYVLRDDARGVLDQDAKLLRDNSGVKVTVEGHCDERGTSEYNQALGEKRAQAARDYLVNAGIDASRLQVVSYGKERPFDPGHDESAWAKNRRAHFVTR
jgi:peptidoglycan-associated lipoprotein